MRQFIINLSLRYARLWQRPNLPRYIIAVIQFAMGLAIVCQPEQGVSGYFAERWALVPYVYAGALFGGAAALIACNRIERDLRPLVFVLGSTPFGMYCLATVSVFLFTPPGRTRSYAILVIYWGAYCMLNALYFRCQEN